MEDKGSVIKPVQSSVVFDFFIILFAFICVVKGFKQRSSLYNHYICSKVNLICRCTIISYDICVNMMALFFSTGWVCSGAGVLSGCVCGSVPFEDGEFYSA